MPALIKLNTALCTVRLLYDLNTRHTSYILYGALNNNIMDLWINLGSLMREVDNVKLKSPAKSEAI